MENETEVFSINQSDCYKVLKKYVSQVSVTLCSYEINNASDKIVGFLGDYFRLRISFKQDQSPTKQEASFFVKTEPIFNENQRNFVQGLGVFQKELFIYELILPKLMEISGMNFAPICYLTNRNFIVLEDLRKEHFHTIKEDLNVKECLSLVKCLANFHGASIVFEELNYAKGKDNNSWYNYNLLERLVEGTFSFTEGKPQYLWLKCVITCIINFWKKIPGYDDKSLRKRLTEVVFNGKLEKLIKPSTHFRNVLTHNDLWSNNIMFDPNSECKLIDFQLVRYTPPAYDLLMALYLNTSTDFLSIHYNYMINAYYSEIAMLATRYNLDCDEIFPRNQFEESLKIYKLPALIESAAFSTNVFLPEERTASIKADTEKYHEFNFSNRSKYNLDLFDSDPFFRKKVLAIILPLAEILREL